MHASKLIHHREDEVRPRHRPDAQANPSRIMTLDAFKVALQYEIFKENCVITVGFHQRRVRTTPWSIFCLPLPRCSRPSALPWQFTESVKISSCRYVPPSSCWAAWSYPSSSFCFPLPSVSGCCSAQFFMYSCDFFRPTSASLRPTDRGKLWVLSDTSQDRFRFVQGYPETAFGWRRATKSHLWNSRRPFVSESETCLRPFVVCTFYSPPFFSSQA